MVKTWKLKFLSGFQVIYLLVSQEKNSRLRPKSFKIYLKFSFQILIRNHWTTKIKLIWKPDLSSFQSLCQFFTAFGTHADFFKFRSSGLGMMMSVVVCKLSHGVRFAAEIQSVSENQTVIVCNPHGFQTTKLCGFRHSIRVWFSDTFLVRICLKS